ncbi:PH domain-containing protein [Natrinema altunense]|uniref:PH domain-containing protein n=1 Tax=Natrinema altunense TaxID=222984 RepID=A0A482XXE3_9EURY|nr:PH domain-containing protein [Natrinema altunense]RZH68558.1 PH domain-containing protein [Natrinema altunense]
MTRTSPSEPDAGSEARSKASAESTPHSGDSAASVPPWLPLEEGDRVRWQAGPRVQTVLPWAVVALVGTVLLLAAVAVEWLPILAVVGVPAVLAPALWQYARVSRTAFVVTDGVAATRRGVLGRTVRIVSLERVQNTTVEQDPVGRYVGYGTVTIETAGGSPLRFRNIERPGEIRDRLEAERDRLTGSEVPGGRDQWEAVLAEVRAWRRALEHDA